MAVDTGFDEGVEQNNPSGDAAEIDENVAFFDAFAALPADDDDVAADDDDAMSTASLSPSADANDMESTPTPPGLSAVGIGAPSASVASLGPSAGRGNCRRSCWRWRVGCPPPRPSIRGGRPPIGIPRQADRFGRRGCHLGGGAGGRRCPGDGPRRRRCRRSSSCLRRRVGRPPPWPSGRGGRPPIGIPRRADRFGRRGCPLGGGAGGRRCHGDGPRCRRCRHHSSCLRRRVGRPPRRFFDRGTDPPTGVACRTDWLGRRGRCPFAGRVEYQPCG